MGVAQVALAGALCEIARLGGGYNGTVAMFDRYGFTPTRQIGNYRWVVNRMIEPAQRRGGRDSAGDPA
jgi:hypothetical protein